MSRTRYVRQLQARGAALCVVQFRSLVSWDRALWSRCSALREASDLVWLSYRQPCRRNDGPMNPAFRPEAVVVGPRRFRGPSEWLDFDPYQRGIADSPYDYWGAGRSRNKLWSTTARSNYLTRSPDIVSPRCRALWRRTQAWCSGPLTHFRDVGQLFSLESARVARGYPQATSVARRYWFSPAMRSGSKRVWRGGWFQLVCKQTRIASPQT